MFPKVEAGFGAADAVAALAAVCAAVSGGGLATVDEVAIVNPGTRKQ